MGKDENGPLPLELGLRVPLPGLSGPSTAPDTSNDRSVGRMGPKVPANGGSIDSHAAGVTKNTEPLNGFRGSDTHTLWRTGRDSNPRRSFPLARFPSACLQPLSHLSKDDLQHLGLKRGAGSCGIGHGRQPCELRGGRCRGGVAMVAVVVYVSLVHALYAGVVADR
jgi:hypothetical protein